MGHYRGSFRIVKPLLTRRALRFLLHLAEREPPVVAHRILTQEARDDGRDLISGKLLLPGKPLNSIHIELVDGWTSASVDRDEDTGQLTYFHPEAGFLDADPDELRTWLLDIDALIDVLGKLLGMPASFKAKPLVPGVLWDMGTPRLGRRTGIPVLFGRRLDVAEARAAVREELTLRLGNKPALLLTSTCLLPHDLTFPAVACLISVATILSESADVAEFDVDRLSRLADRPITALAHAEALAQCSPDGAWLRIHDREYTFRGKKKRLIRLLYEAWERGESWMSEVSLLAEAEYDSKRIEDVFKDSRPGKSHEWREYIDVHDGKVRMKVPQQD
jgi:hypothetical protein